MLHWPSRWGACFRTGDGNGDARRLRHPGRPARARARWPARCDDHSRCVGRRPARHRCSPRPARPRRRHRRRLLRRRRHRAADQPDAATQARRCPGRATSSRRSRRCSSSSTSRRSIATSIRRRGGGRPSKRSAPLPRAWGTTCASRSCSSARPRPHWSTPRASVDDPLEGRVANLRARRRRCAADRRADLVPARRDSGVPVRHSDAQVRRGNFRRRSDRPRDVARAGAADDGDPAGRPLGRGIRRRDRHDEGQPGSRRADDDGARPGALPGHAARASPRC